MSSISLKPGWKMVELGEVVEEISQRINEPANSGYERFVGLEHFESGNLKIRQWGSTENLVSAMKIFKAGDTLFARRNAYLRRASMVDFDGVCSGDAIVLREVESKMVHGFLPLVLNTNRFWEYALSNAAGSMSKRVNVDNFLKYEFPLPPIEEQRQIAEILWAADEALEGWISARNQLDITLKTVRAEIFKNLDQDKNIIPLKDVGKWVSGGTPSRDNKEFWGGNFLWVSPKDMKKDIILDTEEKLTEKALLGRLNILEPNCILFVVRGMILAHTFPVARTGIEVTFNQDIKGIIPNSDFLPQFVFQWFKENSSKILQLTESSTHGTKRLATDVLYKMMIPKPSKKKQEEILEVLESFCVRLEEINKHIQLTKLLTSSLSNTSLNS